MRCEPMVMRHFIDYFLIIFWTITIGECNLPTGIDSSLQARPRQCAALVVQAGVSHTCTNRTVGVSCWAYCQSGYTGPAAQYACNSAEGSATPILAAVDNSIYCSASARRLTVRDSGRRLAGECDASIATLGLTGPGIETDCSGKATGETCIAYCGTGYTMVEQTPGIVTCGGDGNFQFLSGGVPTCTPTPCTFSFPAGLGVSSDCQGKGTGETCSAICTGAYNYEDGEVAQTFTCGLDGSFTGTSPVCAPKPCTVQAELASYKTESCVGLTDAQTCGVSCATGYTGEPVLYKCNGTTGDFGPVDPSSALNCIPNECTTGLPLSADLNTSALVGLTTGQTGQITCASGFQGQAETWTCNESGTIKGVNPECEPMKCDPSTLPDSGNFTHTCGDIPFQGSCTMSCNEGYEFHSGGSIETWECALNPDGGVHFTGMTPKCQSLLCDTSGFAGLYLDNGGCEGIRTDESCSYSCLPGFEPAEGEPHIYHFDCIGSGVGTLFNGTRPNCKAKTCDTSHLDGVINTCAGIEYGEECLIQCEAGYVGNGTQECKFDTADNTTVSLQGPELVCVGNPCLNSSLPVGPQHNHDCQGLRTNETCTVSCAEGYDGEPVTVMCTATGFFEGRLDGVAVSIPPCPVVTSTSTVSMTSVTDTTVTATETSVSSTITTTTVTETTASTVTTATSVTQTATTVTQTDTHTTQTSTIVTTETSTATVTTVSTTTVPAGEIPTVSAKVLMTMTNPSTFVTDANAKTGFNQFMATYMGVAIDQIVSVFTEVTSRKLRRLQVTGQVEAAVTVNVPPGGTVDKTQVTQKFTDLDDTEDTQLAAALNDAGATGFDPNVDSVSDIQDGTAAITTTTQATQPPTAPPPTQTEDEGGMAGGIIALIVILCIVFVGCVVAGLVFVYLRRQQEENNNSNDKGQSETNADNTGEIPPESMDEHGDEQTQVRARAFQVNLPQAEDNATGDEPEAIRS